MGWAFRKSKSLGPLKLNFSKSGIGFSVGTKGFRTGINAKGKKYTQISIPGSGISYRFDEKNKNPQTEELNDKDYSGIIILIIIALVIFIIFKIL